ncbi:MAG: carboxypeptidase regulatory-like domain-containing protein [Bryobacterales bacterium]|nr:carboxypeptidase regulatory-like domain-containing protein [Bryobacterales bacterium]
MNCRISLLAGLLSVTGLFAQQMGQIKGTVVDPSAASVPGATVNAKGPSTNRTATTNEMGAYEIDNVPPGKYNIRISAPGFTPFEIRNARVNMGSPVEFKVQLSIASQTESVTVADQEAVSVDPQSTAGAVVLKGEDLNVLSDDPDDLASDLQALAGPSAGPNGGEIFVDGFSGGQLPPKSAIREVRINQNPFSAEYDKMGFGRIEILTKPGTDKMRGQAFFSFGDQYLNSRNPFSPTRAPYKALNFGVNLGGPINKKASYFIDVERRGIDENAVVNATILDPNLQQNLLQQAIVTPIRRLFVSPRIDYQLSTNNTLVARYHFSRMEQDDQGIGQFTLPSRALNMDNDNHTLQLTETSVLNAKMINETRFQYMHVDTRQMGNNATPAINVLESFNAGGALIGNSGTGENHFEVTNMTSITQGTHFLKLGGRARVVSVNDSSDSNFNGTFTFAGGLAPQLNASNQAVLGPDGQPVLTQITSLDRYQRTLLFQSMNLPFAQIRQLGGGPSQFTLTSGLATSGVNQTDIGVFAEDSWRLRPRFTLNYGLRYETQTNIHNYNNIAPRLSIAWGLDGGKNGKTTKTVLRTGFGMFYDRIDDSLTLQALRFNGTTQQQYFVLNPGFYPNIPSLDSIANFKLDNTVRRLAPDIRAPYIAQGVIGVDRQLPWRTSLSANFIYSRGEHMLRTVNINAPLPDGTRPLGNIGNLYQFESNGILRQKQFMVNLRSQFNRRVMLFGFYVYGHANSDTDGVGTFPANPYNFATEYGRASYDVRHRFVMGGNINGKWGISLNPFIIASSGPPFNITTGRDNNGDTIFNDRPAQAAPGATGADIVATQFGVFNIAPGPGAVLIPRDYGNGPGNFTVNLRLSKTWGFGDRGERAAQAGPAGPDRPPMMMGGPGGGRGGYHGGGGGFHGGGGGGMFGASNSEKRFNLTLSASARNLFNHVNLGLPVGNLSSPLFGESTSIAGGFGPGGAMGAAGNRRLELQLRLSF